MTRSILTIHQHSKNSSQLLSYELVMPKYLTLVQNTMPFHL